jgi:hypothetical protein
MIRRVLAVAFLCALTLVPSSAHAQTSAPRIFLMTMGPGDAVWERFGHNGIVIEDPSFGSYVFDWGRFSFDQPGYVRRLMKGRMLYWTEGAPTQLMISHYAQMNRSVWLQELNLTPEQAVALRDFVLWNQQEENKFYRYDYYRDNCSTRIRDAIDRALGGQLKTFLTRQKVDETYRSHTQRLTFDDVPTYTGLQLAMGHPIDQPLTAWEESFIPMELQEWVRRAKVRDASGREVPLVVREVTVFQANREPHAERAPNLIVWYLLAGLLFAGLLILLAWRRGTRTRTVVLAVLIGAWAAITGFFGLLIGLLWAFTDHAVTYYNENVLQANPLLLILAVAAPMALLGRGRGRKTAARVALVVAGLSVLGFVLQIMPNLDQVNGEIIALFLPVHVAIAYILSSPRKIVTA